MPCLNWRRRLCRSLFSPNEDGQLDANALDLGLRKISGTFFDFTPEQLAEILQALDTDGNGILDYEEWDAFVEEVASQNPTTSLQITCEQDHMKFRRESSTRRTSAAEGGTNSGRTSISRSRHKQPPGG